MMSEPEAKLTVDTAAAVPGAATASAAVARATREKVNDERMTPPVVDLSPTVLVKPLRSRGPAGNLSAA
jgi:hypothetical protein